jgi:hypothetical protein
MASAAAVLSLKDDPHACFMPYQVLLARLHVIKHLMGNDKFDVAPAIRGLLQALHDTNWCDVDVCELTLLTIEIDLGLIGLGDCPKFEFMTFIENHGGDPWRAVLCEISDHLVGVGLWHPAEQTAVTLEQTFAVQVTNVSFVSSMFGQSPPVCITCCK